MTTKNESTLSNDEKIALRNNWLKILVVTTATLVIGVKIWQADFSQAFAAFNFSDLLALFLALFSIALSVLFYLKATDTSNVFYDNTYRFTRDVSEILGRVEAGFGEKLAHLDEGYSGLKNAVEKIPFDMKQAEQDIEEEKQVLHKVEEEREKLFEDLAARASLEDEEKKALFERLKIQDEELTSAKKEISFLQHRIKMAEGQLNNGTLAAVPDDFLYYLKKDILNKMSHEKLQEAPMRSLNEHFKLLIKKENTPSLFIRDLRKFGVIDNNDDLTRSGRTLLRKLLSVENL